MKHFLAICLFIPLSLGCTSESKVKTLALDAARARFDKQIEQEIASRFAADETFKNNYRSLIKSKTDFTVASINLSEKNASVVVKIETVPKEAREALMAIMNSQKDKNAYSFNVTDALELINQKQGRSPSSKAEETRTIYLQNRDGWTVSSD